MASALDVAGGLTVLAGADPFRVDFRGEVIAIELPDLRAARALGRSLPRRARRDWLRRAQSALGLAGLELQVWVGPRRVARLAAGSRPGRLAKALGLDPMELRVGPILALLARRRGTGADGGTTR